MLRLLVLALLLANALFFTWTHGGFSGLTGAAVPNTTEADREPQRLAAQLRPEIIQVLPASSASAAASAASAASSASAASVATAEAASAPESASAPSPAPSGASSAAPS